MTWLDYENKKTKEEEDRIYRNFLFGMFVILALVMAVIFFSCTPIPARAEEVPVEQSVTITEEQKKINQLQSAMQVKIIRLLRDTRELYPQYKIVLAETYRSQERQDKLFAKGPHVTTVRVSKHTQGLAADIYFTNGLRILKYEEAPYAVMGEMGEALGLTWGGYWKAPFDPGHFEWRG